MLYSSTRGNPDRKRFCEILLEGLAPDGGLYLPEAYPQVSDATLQQWRNVYHEQGYAALAFEILSLYIDDIPAADLRALCAKTYTAEVFGTGEIVPLRHLKDGVWIEALSNGPTLAFKDMAMQLLGNLFEFELARRGEQLNIKAVEFGIGRSFFRGPEALGSWGFDEESPFEQIRVLDPASDQGAIRYLVGRLEKLYPALKDVAVAQAWGAYIDSTPGAVPVISPVDQIKGFVLAAGFSGHGFGTGPGTGQLAASLVTGEQPPVDPTPFRFSRFGDGSKVTVGAI